MPVAPHSSFPVSTGVDLGFRPDSYVADWCAVAATLQNITGEGRREAVHREWLDRLNAIPRRRVLPERWRADRLPPAEAARWAAGFPTLRVSGEYLPRYRRGEVEVARLVLDTRPPIVYSVRAFAAKPAPGARPRATARHAAPLGALRDVRIVDEYGTSFTHDVASHAAPLALSELIRGIDGVRSSVLPAHPAHLPFPEALVLEGAALSRANRRLHTFVQVSSAVYPELHTFYRQRLAWWVRQHFSVESLSGYMRRTWADTLTQWWSERTA
jgi:hypothetical protein